MKQLILLLAAGFSFLSFNANAQDNENAGPKASKVVAESDEEESEEVAESPKVVYADPTSMDQTTMAQDGEKIIFNDLPQISAMTAHITDANGNEVISKTLNLKKNTVDISRLRKGMHFVTLMSDNSGKRKSFTLTVE